MRDKLIEAARKARAEKHEEVGNVISNSATASAVQEAKTIPDFLNEKLILEEFMASEDCQAGCDLLLACNESIPIFSWNEGGGYGVYYFLDSAGLQQTIAATGTWFIYAKEENVRKPETKKATCTELMRDALIHSGPKTAQELIDYLKMRFTQIADRVLNK